MNIIIVGDGKPVDIFGSKDIHIIWKPSDMAQCYLDKEAEALYFIYLSVKCGKLDISGHSQDLRINLCREAVGTLCGAELRWNGNECSLKVTGHNLRSGRSYTEQNGQVSTWTKTYAA